MQTPSLAGTLLILILIRARLHCVSLEKRLSSMLSTFFYPANIFLWHKNITFLWILLCLPRTETIELVFFLR